MKSAKSLIIPKIIPLFLLFFTLSIAQGATFPQPPDENTFYVDTTNSIVDETTGSQINQISSQLLDEEDIPIYVVVIQSLAEQQAENLKVPEYAMQLFDNWGIGSQERNYGMLLLVSLGDREARIELGEGFQHNYDRDASRIMDTLIIPQFRNDQYASGILAGVEGLNAMARGLDIPRPEWPAWAWPALIIGAIALVGIIISLFLSGRKGLAWALIVTIGVILGYILMSAVRNIGKGGGRRGGSSGGGGASGRW
jgi:uncharacterized protein